MTVDPLASAGQAPFTDGAASAAPVPTSNELGKDAFLSLLVTQLSNQDPLAPSDATEFVSQLAQFTSLEQLVAVNDGLSVLAISQTAATSAQMVGFVGREVLYRGDEVHLAGAGDSARLEWRQESAATDVTVTVRDDDGQIVRTLELGARPSGEVSFQLDGLDDDGVPLAAGSYTFDVQATGASGEAISVVARARGVVLGVTFRNGYPELVLEGGRTIGLGQVVEVKELATAAPAPGGESTEEVAP